jgi:tetratricopeptide (TPR) repeat protein
MVGIIQEQHPHRARLFMQWKHMDWPVLVDAYNLLGTSLVPITLLIDEHGIVRHAAPSASRAGEMLDTFLATTYEAPVKTGMTAHGGPDLASLEQRARRVDTAEAWRGYADALALWGRDERLDQTVEAYGRVLEGAPDHGPTEFRLGVTLRRRYDSALGDPADFGRAVEHWTRALEIDPNNYIWRRRIQQYGPRLTKPYPFYDWVGQARSDIEARGGTPVALRVEPRGAELAHPAREFDVAAAPPEPDPEGRILRDKGKYVRLDSTVVPPAVRPGGTARLHLEFRLNPAADAHWNNEAAGLLVWFDPPQRWQLDQRRVALPQPATAVSKEARRVEFEIRCDDDVMSPTEIPGYALYYVCESAHGACLYRRQDFSLTVAVAGDEEGG